MYTFIPSEYPNINKYTTIVIIGINTYNILNILGVFSSFTSFIVKKHVKN